MECGERRTTETNIADLTYYRQAGGCIEATIQNSTDANVDILHFCTDAEALAFCEEFKRLIEEPHTPRWGH